MNEHRDRMMQALKTRFIPPLRERGFVGSFPHLRRPRPDRIDYLTVQFYSAGGSFVVEIGRTGSEGFTDGPWKDLPVAEINVGHIFQDRTRLGPRDAPGGWRGARWFQFGPRNYDSPTPVQPQEFYDRIAKQALAIFVSRGEPWLDRPGPLESGAPQPKPTGPPPWPFGDGPFAGIATLLPWNRPSLRVACLVAGSEPPLHRWQNWQKVIAPISGLVKLLPRPTSIRSYQNRPGRSEWLPFGRLSWSEASNRKWTTQYLESSESVQFEATEIWSPSRSTWSEEGKDPELYAKVDLYAVSESQGFILALRRDLLMSDPRIGEAADGVVAAVSAALPGAARVIFDRGWHEKRLFGVIAQNPLDYAGSRAVLDWAEAHPRTHVDSFTSR